MITEIAKITNMCQRMAAYTTEAAIHTFFPPFEMFFCYVKLF